MVKPIRANVETDNGEGAVRIAIYAEPAQRAEAMEMLRNILPAVEAFGRAVRAEPSEPGR